MWVVLVLSLFTIIHAVNTNKDYNVPFVCEIHNIDTNNIRILIWY